MIGEDPQVAFTVRELLIDLRKELAEFRREQRETLEKHEVRLNNLELWKANWTGRMIALGAVVAVLLALAQFGVRLVTGH